jgi:hypothetical protein
MKQIGKDVHKHVRQCRCCRMVNGVDELKIAFLGLVFKVLSLIFHLGALPICTRAFHLRNTSY